MPSSIPLTGFAANDRVPGHYVEVNFAQGAASLGSTEYAVILQGNMTSGSADPAVKYGPDTIVPMSSAADAALLFGEGSELHRGVLQFLKVNRTSKLYCIAVEDPAGVDGYADITFTNTATASGAVRIWVQDEFVDTAIVTGDTVDEIAANVEDNINGKSHWAVVAEANAGVVTISAKQSGPRGNHIRFKPMMIGSVGTVVSPTAVSNLAFGAVADDNSDVLAATANERFYYIVSAASDATQVGNLLSQVNTQALPITGMRQRVFAGSVDTIANAITFATGLNGARAEVLWQPESDLTPFELACSAAAVYSLEEAPAVPRCNFSSYGSDDKSAANWKIKAPISGARPSRAQILSALNNGITPIAVAKNGSTYLVKRVTTKSQTSSLPDLRVSDAHKVTICDRFADDLQLQFVAKFSGKLIGDDPIGNEVPPGPSVCTPRIVEAEVDAMIDLYADRDLLQNREEIKAGVVVIREASPTTRMSVSIPLQTVDLFDQSGVQINQVA